MRMPLALGSVRGAPSMRIEPESGCKNPTIMFINVVFPHPDGPTMATNSPSPTVKLTSSTTCSVAPFDPKDLRMPLTSILVRIAPPDRFEALEQSHDAVEQQSNQPDDDHSGDHQIVSITGVARIDDEVSQSRTQGNHLRRDHDQPSHTQPAAHADDNLGQHRRDHHLTKQRVARDAEILRGSQIAALDGVHAGGRLHDHWKYRRNEDEIDGRGIADA